MREKITDEEVEQEIARLQSDKDVKLAKKEQNLKYKRRQYLCNLRALKNRGKDLRRSGITAEILEQMYSGERE